jgi:hypothetical protein
MRSQQQQQKATSDLLAGYTPRQRDALAAVARWGARVKARKARTEQAAQRGEKPEKSKA